MNNVAENLERFFTDFIGQASDWEFFKGLRDYVLLVQNTQETSCVVAEWLEHRSEAHRLLEQYEQEALAEIQAVAKRLLAEIRCGHVSVDGLDAAIKDCENCIAGRIVSSLAPVQELSLSLNRVVDLLFLNGHQDLVKDYARANPKSPDGPPQILYGKKLRLFEKENAHLAEKTSAAIWGDWGELMLVADAMGLEETQLEAMHEACLEDLSDVKHQQELFGRMLSYDDKKKLEGGRQSMTFNRAASQTRVRRVHKYLMARLATSVISSIEAVHADVRQIKQVTTPLPGVIGQLEKGVQTIAFNTEAIAKNDYELRQENAELQRLYAEGFLKFAAKVKAEDFEAFVSILLHGNRKKAAEALRIRHRSFYDRVEKWPELGPEYKRMFRMVEWRKRVGRKIIVRLEDSLLYGESTDDKPENPETNRDVQDSKNEESIDSRDYPDILRQILEAMRTQNVANWPNVQKEVIAIIRDELPQ